MCRYLRFRRIARDTESNHVVVRDKIIALSGMQCFEQDQGHYKGLGQVCFHVYG